MLLAGFLLRVGFVMSLPNRPLDGDEPDYVNSAVDIVQHGSFDKAVYYHVPPLVPILYSGVVLFFGKSFLAPRVLNCFLFFLISLVAFKFGQELAGKLAGFLCLMIVAIYPYFIFFSGYAMTETAATLVIPLALYFGVKSAKSPVSLNALLFGVLLAVSALTRSASYLFILAVPLVFLIALGAKNIGWVKLTAIAVAGFMVLYLPWSFVNYRHFGKIIPSPTIGSGVMLYETALRITMPDPEKRFEYFKDEIKHKYYYPPGGSDKDRLAGDEYLSREGKRIILKNLDKYPSVVWTNFKRFWQFYPDAPEGGSSKRRGLLYEILGLGSYGVLFPFMIIGAVICFKRFRHLAVLYGFILYYTLVHSMLYGKLRYRLPLDPVLIAFAVAGITWLLKEYRPGWYKKMTVLAGCNDSNFESGDK